MMRGRRLPGSLVAVLLAIAVVITFGTSRSEAQTQAATVDVLPVNLDQLIDAAARDRNRFAVDISHSIDTIHSGTWSVVDGVATWRYSVRVPTAVSLSFHATNITLPASAQLTVRGGGNTYTYRSPDTNGRELWSRIAKGDSLELQLSVAPRDRREVELQIVSLQAGYRGFGRAVADHPRYTRIKLQSRAASTSSCIVNYECDVTTANTPAAQATVAIIVGNAYQCSGTLLNDVPGDGKPYILTARHCENGKLGGGNPGAAANVAVYWNAVSACGTALGTLYDPGIPTQQGATTVAEQQDAWLLLLNSAPVVNDAYLAGFDATGGPVQGGYTVHHALSNKKQFTEWNGLAFADTIPSGSDLNVTYTSNFWGVVNRTGTIGPGASGSALFDQNDRVVGPLSLGTNTGATADGYDACPSASPPTPSAQNLQAYFTSLAAVWSSTDDHTSSTQTFKQILDPGNTGSRIVDSIKAPAAARLSASDLTVSTGFYVNLAWSATGASSCVASGGIQGDGWSGSLSSSGNQSVSESVAGAVTFAITCTFPGGRISQAQATVTWVPPNPLADVFAPRQAWLGGTFILSYSTNSPPCQLTGGSVSQTVNGSYGQISVKEDAAGDYTYHISCGTGSKVAVDDAFVSVIQPTIQFVTGTTDLKVGQSLELEWHSIANSCTPSGGAPNDGWSVTQTSGVGAWNFFTTATGTYTYSLTCNQGAASATATATIVVENDPPYATMSVSSSQIAVGQSMTASYKSNLAQCYLDLSRVGVQAQGISGGDTTGGRSEGSRTFSGGNVGASQLIFICGNPAVITTDPQLVTVVAAVSASVSAPPDATTGTAFMLAWQSSDAASCTADGGGADGTRWTGNVATSGQQSITPTKAGTLTYSLTCIGHAPNDTKTAQVTVNVTTPVSQDPPPASKPNDSSSGGGGGAFDWLTLAFLGSAGLLTRVRGAKRSAYVQEIH